MRPPADPSPGLVIFDDAQRCDRVGADQLGRHITDARARRAVVLVACRSGEARATDPWWPERLRGDRSAVTVRLGPLSERSVGVLLGDRASVWRAGARRPGPGRARRRRGPPPQADPTRPRQPHPLRAVRRRARGRRPYEPRNRQRAVRHPQHRLDAPAQRLPQTQHLLPNATAGSLRAGRTPLTSRDTSAGSSRPCPSRCRRGRL